MNHDLLTIDELAERVKVRKSWVYGETRKSGEGSIPRLKVGKYLRFSLAEVLEWLRKRPDEA